MRLQLNLNQYYDGLDISQTNAIFSKFIEMKIKIEKMKLTLKTPKEERDELWKVTLKLYSKSIQERVHEINSYMESIGKERIFEVGESIEDTNFEAIISRYEYLMSAPEKEEKNTADNKEHGDR